MKQSERARQIMERIAAGERLLMVFRFWIPGSGWPLEWESEPCPPVDREAQRLYQAVAFAGNRGWLEPSDISEDKRLIVLTDAGRQELGVTPATEE